MGMGEYITVDEMFFVIKKENIRGAAEALLRNKDKLNLYDSRPEDTRWTARLKSLMENAGWEPEIDGVGEEIVWLQLTIDEIPSYTDDFFNTLAPYVVPNSFIQAHKESDGGATWRWVFNGHTCERQYASYDFHGYGKIVKALLERDDIATFIGLHPDMDKLISTRLSDEKHKLKPVFTADLLMQSLDRKPNWSRKELVAELGLEIPENYYWYDEGDCVNKKIEIELEDILCVRRVDIPNALINDHVKRYTFIRKHYTDLGYKKIGDIKIL